MCVYFDGRNAGSAIEIAITKTKTWIRIYFVNFYCRHWNAFPTLSIVLNEHNCENDRNLTVICKHFENVNEWGEFYKLVSNDLNNLNCIQLNGLTDSQINRNVNKNCYFSIQSKWKYSIAFVPVFYYIPIKSN